MDSRIIKLTPAAFKYGNLNLSSCGKDFFPPDVFGGSSKKAGLGKLITIQAEGITDTIKTDIPTDKKSGRPRWIFRERSWSKNFANLHKLKSGDTILLIRRSPRKYCITPNGKRQNKGTFLLIPSKEKSDFVTLEQAARLVGKTPANIRYYIQVGRINKYDPSGRKISKARNGQLRVSLKELKNFLYMLERDIQRHHNGNLSEELGFYGRPEYERTNRFYFMCA